MVGPGRVRRAMLLTCAVTWLAGCLPDRLTQAELQAKIAAATATDSAAEVGPDTVAGPGCGNGVVEDPEECDEAGAPVCGGCATCQRRRVLKATNAKVTALIPNAKTKSIEKLLGDSKSGFSAEAWFNTSKLPAVNGADAFLVVGTVGSPTAPSWLMGLKREGDKNAMYATCAYSFGPAVAKQFVFAQSADPVAPNTWHHLRCAISGKTSKVLLSLDGGTVRESATALGKLPGTGKSAFDSNAVLAIGAIAGESDKADQRFDGLIDEVRVVIGAAADDFGQLRYRYIGTELGTQLLYHMDLGPGDKALPDSSVNGLAAQQASANDGFGTHVLTSAPENCYGQPADAVQCKVAAPWCP